MEPCGIFGSASRSGEDLVRNTAGDGGKEKCTIVSVVENRAREICICKIETSNVKATSSPSLQIFLSAIYFVAQNSLLEIVTLTDNHSYNETVGALRMINPDEILLHDGTRHGVLARKVEQECRDDARILYISRQVILLFIYCSLYSALMILKHISILTKTVEQTC